LRHTPPGRIARSAAVFGGSTPAWRPQAPRAGRRVQRPHQVLRSWGCHRVGRPPAAAPPPAGAAAWRSGTRPASACRPGLGATPGTSCGPRLAAMSRSRCAPPSGRRRVGGQVYARQRSATNPPQHCPPGAPAPPGPPGDRAARAASPQTGQHHQGRCDSATPGRPGGLSAIGCRGGGGASPGPTARVCPSWPGCPPGRRPRGSRRPGVPRPWSPRRRPRRGTGVLRPLRAPVLTRHRHARHGPLQHGPDGCESGKVAREGGWGVGPQRRGNWALGVHEA
jgi:hypothetical protein